ncbi:Cof-type HAD-IIB family hydrolase [Weissella ceti]|uniref:Cof-type HAD-IIB family hydrolase n=1 Tax=Weissella ceti TaxID=759620 RepID=A0ABT3E411_9LACO|nr:Cof-type HAD-IIB family hydrolase [Weissella ceti]MCW0953159.1 Cof-type HAD-IIB family hydrolase [Weissella ceti]QVK12678.1 Cof-type HAD-IIB family hydrolase [Weissella ceti]
MPEIKMVATDLDGTFFDDQKNINKEKFDRVLDYFEAHNMRFVIATGNDKRVVDRVFADFYGRYDYVINNGGVVIDADQKQYRKSVLETSDIEDITKTLLSENITWRAGIVYTGEEDNYMHEDFIGVGERFPLFESYLPNLKFVKALADFEHDRINKITFDCLPEEADRLIAVFNNKFEGRLRATTSGYGSVDVIPADVDKATGLTYLLDAFNVQPEEVMAFGDGMNDYEMLKFVGMPISMPNGEQRLINEFENAVSDNNHDGVLDTIIQKLNIN